MTVISSWCCWCILLLVILSTMLPSDVVAFTNAFTTTPCPALYGGKGPYSPQTTAFKPSFCSVRLSLSSNENNPSEGGDSSSSTFELVEQEEEQDEEGGVLLTPDDKDIQSFAHFSSTISSKTQQTGDDKILEKPTRTSLVLDNDNDIEEKELIITPIGLASPLPLMDDENENDTDSEQVVIVDKQLLRDEKYMRMAIQMAQSAGGERGAASAYPNPTVGAVLVSDYDIDDLDTDDEEIDGGGMILGQGRSDYNIDAIRSCFDDAGLDVTPLSEWLVAWPADTELRNALSESTLYITLEPSNERRGTALPPLTHLVQQAGIQRIVIGCADPIPDQASKGAAALHSMGLEVTLGGILQEECENLITTYAELANSKLRNMARKHFKLFGRPLGFLHCSVVESDNLEAFARQGNAFGTNFGGKNLSYRDFGSYEIAPPPELVWADGEGDDDEDFETEISDPIFSVDFEDEDYQGDMTGNPMMPWYEQVDAVVATFPRPGNGPPDDDSLTARLNGLKWLATHGERCLPAGVERILVMDATDLKDLPLTNDNPDLPKGCDVEAFWEGIGRKPTRVLLRRGANAQAKAAADAAVIAAKAAAEAAEAAAAAIESGDAARAAEAAIEYQQSAQAKTEFIQKELQAIQQLRTKLESKGVIVETIEGGEPVDVMKHLGKRNGLQTVVWRAGCWSERGVQSILDGAFQWVSAHLAVDAVGGKFWQLMVAENAVQAACGPVSKVKVFADQEDVSLEYCDQADADTDCTLMIDGRPVRHIRLDCRVGLVDKNRPREFVLLKTKKLDRREIEEEAPWFL